MSRTERRPAARTGPPMEAPRFVGRRREVSQARQMLSHTRLLTLTGVGGVGKTRLAARVAETLGRTYKDGVETVELATLEAGDLLAPTVAAALGLPEAGPDPATMLVDYLADKRMLLVLDNCEHLLEDCARLVEQLLRGAARLRILVTSRQTLRVSGEQVLVVPSLSVPDHGHQPSDIARHDSVRLFVDRAASVWPGFSLDARNAACLARLAQRLEGIPLAIELAAARLRAVPLEQLTREVEEHFDVVARASPTGLPRHRTLRATMDWSFDLCSPAEQRLWARLSMFPGGTDLDTAEAVCAGDEIDLADVIDLLAGLVDKSVLVGEQGQAGVRYRMLESIRAYGYERLDPSEARALRGRYIDHYRDVVEGHRIDRIVPDQLERYRLLRRELPNVRAALEMCLSEPSTAVEGLETATAMWLYWLLAGSLTEGRYWLERGLDLVPGAVGARAMALWVDSMLALRQGDLAVAMPSLEECHTMARQADNENVLPFAIRTSGLAAFSTGDAPRGLALLEESLALHRATGDIDSVAFNLYYAAVYGSTEDPARAARFGEELLALCETHHASMSCSHAKLALGIAMWNLGDCCRAGALVSEAAEFAQKINDRWTLTQCLEVLAWTAGARGDHERAARTLGAAHALWQVVGTTPARLGYHARWHERCAEQSRRKLGERAFTAAFRDGARHGLEPGLISAIGA
ncbi:ATP-binding protein [Nonomuraea roseola]|uniref:NB-ARC domain-containing protein n=1 Tax=Nonomuraea roseola TaxID=46179 RepID=A0ABV5Q837_9ACTN